MCIRDRFNVLKSMRESASAHEERAAAQAAGLRLSLIHISEAFFRIPQLFQQPPRIFHARMRGQPRQAVYPFQRLSLIHI